MSLHKNRPWHILYTTFLLIALAACGSPPTPPPEAATPAPTEPRADTPEPAQPSPTPTTAAQTPPAPTPTPTLTPTPTAVPLPEAATPAPAASRCEGLAGQLEVQVLVGPADASRAHCHPRPGCRFAAAVVDFLLDEGGG